MSYRPTDLPRLRAEVADWVQDHGPELFQRFVDSGRQAVMPKSPSAGAILAAHEVRRLRAAELFFVSAEMTELAIAASASLPEFTLMPEDVPAVTGLILFERPIYTIEYDGINEAAPLVAKCWSPWVDGRPRHWIHGGLWIDSYADREGIITSARNLSHLAETPGLLDEYRSSVPRLVHDNELQIPFSPDPLPMLEDGELVPFRPSGWTPILKTAWLLMSQPIALVAEAPFNRAARRQAERMGLEPPKVRVITLRRPTGSSGSGASDREYHHQWIVRGHWRQQWYPARGVHRPVWIAPHIKGPEGAPLLGGEKVYAWSR